MTTYDERATTRSVVGRLQPPDLTRMRCALVVIDLQVLDAAHNGEHAQRARELGRWDELEGYFDRVAEMVVPNVVRLGRALRERGLPVIYLRCRSLHPNAADNGLRFREFGIASAATTRRQRCCPSSRSTTRTSCSTRRPRVRSGRRTSTGCCGSCEIECLLMTGVVTSGCVESAVRDASDLDYRVVLVEDACADREPELHDDSIRRMNNNFALVRATGEVLDGMRVARD